jgi:hypothetical protein
MAMLVHQQLYDGKPVSELTQAEKENIRAVATLASGLVGGVAGDGFENAATAASAGYNAAVNNNLAGEFFDEVLRAMDAFPGGSGVKLGAKYTIQEIKLLAKLFKFGKSADEAAAQLKKAPSEIELMYLAIEQRAARNAEKAALSASSAQALYKGSTVAGHALSKHAGRNPEIWGKVSGSMDTWTAQAMRHYNDIVNGPGSFVRTTSPKGASFFDKFLPDGRGIRFNLDGTFKGFLD